MSLKKSVTVLLLLSLSGCASNAPLCPPLGADLAQPYPPPGYFRQQMEAIIKKGQTLPPTSSDSQTKPTK